MAENAVVVASNLYALRALSVVTLFTVEGVLVTAAMLASMLYHGVERHKHHMPGLFGSGTLHEHHVCINIDRACAAALSLWLLARATPVQIVMGAGALVLLALSEAPHVAPQVFAGLGMERTRKWYVLWHTLWHVAAFHLAYLVLS